MPEDVLTADVGEVGFSWDGQSPDPNTAGKMNPNKVTAMDWAEHQRIVFNARGLLASWKPDSHPGHGKKAFKALKDAYDGTYGNRSVLRVAKGIHQPLNNPHMQIRVISTFTDADKKVSTTRYTFHLDVSAREVVGVDGLDTSFQWEGVQFKCEDANTWYRWPAQAVRNMKNSSASRRSSISFASLDKYKTDLAEKEAARLKLEKQKQAELQATNLEAAIRAELKRFEEAEGLVLRMKPAPSPKFFKGTTSAFLEPKKYGKGYNVIWSATEKKLVRTL
jgi:hypothetical protein